MSVRYHDKIPMLPTNTNIPEEIPRESTVFALTQEPQDCTQVADTSWWTNKALGNPRRLRPPVAAESPETLTKTLTLAQDIPHIQRLYLPPTTSI